MHLSKNNASLSKYSVYTSQFTNSIIKLHSDREDTIHFL